MKKSKQSARNKKQREERKWNAILKRCGLPEIKPGFLPRKRRVSPLLDDKGNENERGAVLNLDGTALARPEDTETRLAVTPGAFVALANYLHFDGIERTVLGMRLLSDCTREEVRAYFRDDPKKAAQAMSAWRNFEEKMPEIRAFLYGYRRDIESPVKPHYRPFK